MKIISEIINALNFFKNEGYEVFISLSEDFSDDIRKEFVSFFVDDNLKNKLRKKSVFYDDREIAVVYSSQKKDNVTALFPPLKYMIQRLYDESFESISENNEKDIYRKALQFIKNHYTENITVADVAEHTGYSESYFGYAFKKKYKMSVGQYVRKLQLAKAKDLLESTTFSVSIVASYVGFDDSNYFSALFKKYFGLSPKEYRNLHGTLI